VATYPLRLAGWEERSIIGADEQLGGWFAQLWPNGSTSDPPQEWLDAASPNDLTGPIAAATRIATQDVDTAIANAIAEARRWLASD